MTPNTAPEEVVRIYFKNVGQGDCIFLEWKNQDDEWELAIVDCNNKGKKNNKTLNNLTKHIRKFREINFLLLSHPHYDHFSGIKGLLDFCQEERIGIQYIFDTALSVKESIESDLEDKLLLKSFVKEEDKTKKLKELFDTFKAWESYNGTQRETINNPTMLVKVPKKLLISALSPTTAEAKEYRNDIFIPQGKNLWSINPDKGDANILSTIISIETPKWQVLLTADALTFSFDRLCKSEQRWKVPIELPLTALQVPHHGSKGNHHTEFWGKHLKQDRTVAIISAGQNNTYKHPHQEVVEYFSTNTKAVYATNNVHGFQDYHREREAIRLIDMLETPPSKEHRTNRIADMIDPDLNPVFKTSETCGEQLVRIFEDGRCEVETII